MAALVLAVTPAPPLALSLACAAAAAAYSAVLLRAYLVGPIIGALSNRVAAVPLQLAPLGEGQRSRRGVLLRHRVASRRRR